MSNDSTGRMVVAAVDGSESSRHAARWAAAEADRRRLPLRMVHAVSMLPVPATGGWVAGQNVVDEMVSYGWNMLAQLQTEIADRHLGLDVHTDVVVADAVSTLVTESESAAMLVLGSRGLGGFVGMLAGSTAVALVAHGHCPVAVIRGRGPESAPPDAGPVVVGVDGSPVSETAVALAYEEASLRGAELEAVHSWTEATYAYERGAVVDWTEIDNRQREVLAERLAGWQEKYPDVPVRRVVLRDHPVSALLERSVDAQLLVVGSRGRGGFTGMLLGSTSRALIYHATCPVLVARPTS